VPTQFHSNANQSNSKRQSKYKSPLKDNLGDVEEETAEYEMESRAAVKTERIKIQRQKEMAEMNRDYYRSVGSKLTMAEAHI
jgi:hypothetical protein